MRGILQAVRAGVTRRPPLLVKIAPDLSEDGLASVVEACVDGGAEGLIVSNTTITRPAGLRSPLAARRAGFPGCR